MRRVGVLLSGCGVYDGSDVQETVLLVFSLLRNGLKPVFVCPDVAQQDVVDHASGDVVESAGPRRVVAESARLARGRVLVLDDPSALQIDALAIPGGIGAVKNLCVRGSSPLGGGAPIPEVTRLLDGLAARGSPVAALGLARVVVDRHRDVPLDPTAMSAGPRDVVEEEGGRLLFGSGFMGGDSLADVAVGIERISAALARKLGASSALRVRTESAESEASPFPADSEEMPP